MKVYRVERLDTGKGPYSCEDFETCLVIEESRCGPSPVEDGIWDSWEECSRHKDYFYGFDSVGQLLDWFPAKTMTKLMELGFVVATYDVPDGRVRTGYSHLAFNRSAASVTYLSDEIPEQA
jgi:hypothetical protein